MFTFKSASTTEKSLRSKKSIASFQDATVNDSKISVDSDTGTATQETKPPFKLRVINPDFYEEDNEPPYKPTLVANTVSSTPELRQVSVIQKPQSTSVIVVPPPATTATITSSPNSWQSNKQYSFSDNTTPRSSNIVTRKVSKILVEQKHEYLPPLETLEPLLTMNESHLLSPLTPQSAELSPTTLNQVSPLEALSIKSTSPPPSLPQHSPDYFNSKGSASVAQQSINAMVTSTVEQLPETMDQEDPQSPTSVLSSSTLPAVYNYKHQTEYISSHDLLSQHQRNTLTQLSSRHSRSPSVAPSLSASAMDRPHPTPLSSRYSKASYSLTNNPDAIKLYRNMAMKTGDPTVQLTYAKYLLEVASLYDSKETRQPFRPNLSLSLPLMKRNKGRPSSIASSRRSSIDTTMSTNFRRDSSATTSNMLQNYKDDDEETSKRKKKKMLEEEGVKWIKRLAKQRVGEAAYLLGLWYDRGMYGCRKSATKALKFYEVAANEKVPEAMFAVGQYHEREQDYMTSFQLYEDAASLGLVEALYRIAIINLNGEFGSRRNISGAIQLLMKASETSTGTCPEAPYTLGILLVNDYPSINIPSELIQTYGGTFAATTYLEYAADMGMSIAQYRLGRMYEQGLFGSRINLSKAIGYYELAANTNSNGYAMLGLSRLYNQGIQVPQEHLQEQSIIFEQDESGWCKTQLRDEDAAFRWCHSAAAQNIPDACYLLGWYYEIGIGVPRDFQQAHYYYAKACKKGNHKQAQDRVDLLEGMVKHQRNEKRRTVIQDKRRSSQGNPLKTSRDSQCNIM
ncbi:hypothetical protein HPULCUR_009643 [Helicostylum pulchrum]|uniref:Beta-lactamase n=1 Tax=Helicostylum pulchrum TaxID=562976 RepID=A0ABP9YD14_9FUNG